MFLRRVALLGVIGLAILLMLIAGPRVMAGIELAAAQDVMRQIRTGHGATFQGVMHAIDSRRAAARWDVGPRAQAELGEMLLTLAALDQPQAEEMRGELATEALTATRAAILRSPTQPFAWTRYTQALALKTETERLQAGTPVEEGEISPIDGPLAMAIVTGPWQADLVATRVEMGLFFWYRLSDFTRRLVAGQIFIGARQNPEQLAAVTQRQNALTEVMAILLIDDTLLHEFTRVYYRTQSIDSRREAEGQGAQ
ncbi:MAG: hypothetical protein ACFCVH_18575 [Alphaproteobacteria bacterium]